MTVASNKKSLMIIFLSLVLVMTLSVSSVSAAATEYGGFPVRTEDSGDWGGVWVKLNSGVTSFKMTKYSIKGVHSGEQASIKWTIYNRYGDFVHTFNVNGDKKNHTVNVIGLEAGALYQLVWEATTDNDMDGWFYVTVDGDYYQ